jgi:hypothetical protein
VRVSLSSPLFSAGFDRVFLLLWEFDSFKVSNEFFLSILVRYSLIFFRFIASDGLSARSIKTGLGLISLAS